MTAERWEQIKQLFSEAATLTPVERADFLKNRANGDTQIVAEVNSLLAAHDDPTSFLHRGALGPLEQTKALTRASADPQRGEDRFMPGAVFAGRYRIISMAGHGGMGEVYRAYDLQLKQTIALKFVQAANEDALDRFRNEVRTARQVTHPNVCRVYDIGEYEGAVYLTMEYIDGEDLASLLFRIGRLPEDKALEITRQICAGLSAAHDKNVVHRDLKPGNIMLDGRGHARITDFGLAALAQTIEGNEALHGTPLYMAPEQLAGKEAGPRSDIYALGLVLFEMFTGRRPFEAQSFLELRAQRGTTPVPHPSNLIANLNPSIERAILRCLEVDPKQRPVSPMSIVSAISGRDPVSAALASGETPSPADVAEAGGPTMLSPLIATGLLMVTIAGIFGALVWGNHIGWLSNQPTDLSPELLTHNGRQLAAALGYGSPVDSAWGFVGPRTTSPADNARLEFWYRQAGCVLEPDRLPSGAGLIPPGRIGPENPRDPCPGDLNMFFDLQGKLVRLRGLPPRRGEPGNPDWNKLFNAAGLNPSRLRPSSPSAPPSSTVLDAQIAWLIDGAGRSPERVEGASWKGTPVYFAIGDDAYFQTSKRPPSGASVQRLRIWDASWVLVLFAVAIGAALLVKHNLGLGRGDRRGAFQIARFMFVLSLLIWVSYASHRQTLTEVSVLVLSVGWALFMGTAVWVFYIALEPYVRRRWPRTLTSLQRLMDGYFKDYQVAREILTGMAAGVVFALLYLLRIQIDKALGGATPFVPQPAALTGLRSLFSLVLYDLHSAMWAAFFMYTLLFLLRVMFRRTWLAAAAYILLLSVLGAASEHPGVDIPLTFLTAAWWVFILLRVGVLGWIVSSSLGPILWAMPFTFDFSKWYAAPAFCVVAVLIAIAVYAHRMSMPRRSVLADELLYR